MAEAQSSMFTEFEDPVIYGWTRLSEVGDKCSGAWVHSSGWLIQHCGHPTANYPYAAYGPDGFMVVDYNGRGFNSLKRAKGAVDAVRSGIANVAIVGEIRRVVSSHGTAGSW